MNIQFVRVQLFSMYSVRMSPSIQRLPDESVVITSSTIVEVIVSNTELSWAVKSDHELCTKLLFET